MKNLNHLLLLFVIVALASCNVQVENDASSDSVTIEKSDVTGRWIQTEKTGSSEGTRIIAFNLKDDFTAEVEVEDANGSQTLSGNWELGPEHDSGTFSYIADVSLSFYRDSAQKEVRALAFKEVGEKKILLGDKVAFEKD